jgi:ABC-type cobalamin/Fe3+-siderophores transport system ATPase subunit
MHKPRVIKSKRYQKYYVKSLGVHHIRHVHMNVIIGNKETHITLASNVAQTSQTFLLNLPCIAPSIERNIQYMHID